MRDTVFFLFCASASVFKTHLSMNAKNGSQELYVNKRSLKLEKISCFFSYENTARRPIESNPMKENNHTHKTTKEQEEEQQRHS